MSALAELLREARAEMVYGPGRDQIREELIARIDAALAEHDDQPQAVCIDCDTAIIASHWDTHDLTRKGPLCAICYVQRSRDYAPQVSNHCPVCEARAREERVYGWGVVDRWGFPPDCPIVYRNTISEHALDSAAAVADAQWLRAAPHRVVRLTWMEDTL